MSENLDQPVEEETPAPGVEADAPAVEAQTDETALDEDGNPIEAEEETEEIEEIEHEGVKHALPKALAKEFREGLLRQSDYTRKTQEVAQQREALVAREAEITQQAAAQATTLDERVTLKAVESQLSQYDAIDWTQYAEQHGANAAIAAQGQWQQLQRAKSMLEGTITQKEADFRSASESARSTALQEAVQQLTRDIPGFNSDADIAVTTVAKSFGFTPMELRESLIGADGKPDVRAYKVLAELQRLQAFEAKHTKTTTTAQAAQKQAAVQPARTVGQRAAGYKPGLDDNLPADEWMRRRNAELAKKRA